MPSDPSDYEYNPADFPPKVNNVWGQNRPAGETFLETLPSGQVARLKKIGMEDLIRLGILAEADSLTAMVEEFNLDSQAGVGNPNPKKLKGRLKSEAAREAEANEAMLRRLTENPERLIPVLEIADRVVPLAVVEPAIKSHIITHPVTGEKRELSVEEREPGFVYTDQVPMEDKMHIFNVAMGGTGDEVEQSFRSEPPAALDAVEHESGVPRKGKRARRRK